MIDFRDLVKAGVHFGHQKSRWSPKMAPYIWGFKNNIHLIDVSKTASQLEKASKFLGKLAEDGKSILWVGTKRSAQGIILDVATKLKMPYVNHRWIGGSLSNFPQVKKSITKLLHFEDIIARAKDYSHYTKKELNTYQKVVDRLEKNVGGIRNLKMPIGAVVFVDVRKEQSAVKEAARMGIPVVALVDTNSDPSLVDYVIPANDDAPRSVSIIINYLSDAVAKGCEVAAKKIKEAAAAKAAATKVASETKQAKPDTKKLDSKKVVAAKVADKKIEVAATKEKKVAPVKMVEKKELVKKTIVKSAAQKTIMKKTPASKTTTPKTKTKTTIAKTKSATSSKK